jgi:hypothetical protein
MKKALVALLILAVAGGVFAQDLTLSGEIDTGITIGIPSADGADPFVYLYNDDAGPARFRLNGDFSLENYGLKFRIATEDDFKNGVGNAVSAYACVYANFLNDILTLSAGRIDGSAWATMGDYDTGIDGVTGVRFEVKPITGLNFGFALKVVPIDVGYTISQFFQETVIGAKYTSDLFEANVAFELDSDADAVNSDGDVDFFGGDANSDELKVIFGVSVKAVPKLTAIIDGGVTNLGDFSNAGVFEVHEKFAYAITDPLEAGIVLVEKIYGKSDTDPYLKINPWVSYKLIDPLTARLDVVVETDDRGTYEIFDPIKLTIKPKLTYAVGEKAEIAGWWSSSFTTSDTDLDIPHKLQINFGWKF